MLRLVAQWSSGREACLKLNMQHVNFKGEGFEPILFFIQRQSGRSEGPESRLLKYLAVCTADEIDPSSGQAWRSRRHKGCSDSCITEHRSAGSKAKSKVHATHATHSSLSPLRSASALSSSAQCAEVTAGLPVITLLSSIPACLKTASMFSGRL